MAPAVKNVTMAPTYRPTKEIPVTPEEIKSYCTANSIRFVDVKFVDLFGL